MKDVRTPLKPLKLPAPEFAKLDELPESARADEWARIAAATRKPRGGLLLPPARLDRDAGTATARGDFLSKAAFGVLERSRELHVSHTIPAGSILYNWDPVSDRLRRKSKLPNPNYLRRTQSRGRADDGPLMNSATRIVLSTRRPRRPRGTSPSTNRPRLPFL